MENFVKFLDFFKPTKAQLDWIVYAVLNFPLVYVMLYFCTKSFPEFDLPTRLMIVSAVVIAMHLAASLSLLIYQIVGKVKYHRMPFPLFIPCFALPAFFIVIYVFGYRFSISDYLAITIPIFVIFYGGLPFIALFGRIIPFTFKYIDENENGSEKCSDGEEQPENDTNDN